MITFRFGLRHGDLATFSGRCRLYDLIWQIQPRHIWVSPKCGPWSNWNRLNAMKSMKCAQQIDHDRRAESVHLKLCDALFRLQDWRGDDFHFHLDQPLGSELIYQHDMDNIVRHTLRVTCDMCTAGNLKHPESQQWLRKRTQIWTTSQILWRMLEQFQCVGNHSHDQVAGSCKVAGWGRMSVTKYTELYTALFGKRLCRAMLCSCQVREKVPGTNAVFTITTTSHAGEDPEPKRRRLAGKFHPEHLYIDPAELGEASSSQRPSNVPTNTSSKSDMLSQVCEVLQMAEKCTPCVGKVILQDGPVFDKIQEMFPDKEVKAIDVCRGINRMRTCSVGGRGFAPFRRMLGKRRSDLEVFMDESWEEWEKLSHRQQIRASIPAKLMMTVFASNKRLAQESPQMPDAKEPRVASETTDPRPEANSEPDQSESQHSTPGTTVQTSVTSQSSSVSHGPLFQQLPTYTQNQVRKIHQNLGHPDIRILQMALRRNGWSETEIRGCADFVCPTCHEQQQPKLARPGKLKVPMDFNDHISFDGAEWKDNQGKIYGFYHFVDTATNYQVAIPYRQRTTEGLIEAFSNSWLRWAGPTKSMMFDSATEANSEMFSMFLQKHAIQSYVIPTDAHWQLGRAERHGAVLMHMISKYNSDHPIQDYQDFEQCLIHLCNAKNSMSRHEGYTPELWVLGKMRSLPGNCTDLYLDSASYMGLDEQTPEGSKFQQNMARRESARVAFIKAEHSSELRRALHARSRPERMNFQVGDLIMYWKAGKGVEPGAWHGPAKVLMSEGRNLIWVSHMTRLYRCAPEHIRKLSSDEERSISDVDRSMFQLPERSGNGVFQFRELSQQPMPPENNPMSHQNSHQFNSTVNPMSNEPEVIVPTHPPNNAQDQYPSNNSQIGSEIQPDAEPAVAPTVSEMLQDAINTPIPPAASEEDDLILDEKMPDQWEIRGNQLIRHHVNQRLRVFFPHDTFECPVPFEVFLEERETTGRYISGGEFQRRENWRNNVHSHLPQPEPWTGKTTFFINPSWNQEPSSCLTTTKKPITEHTVLHAEIQMGLDDFQKCLGRTYEYQENYLASTAKRQKIEVKTKDLTPEEAKLFAKAKDKELDSWLATDTVRKILRHQVPEGQLLRSRWVLTWKTLDEQEQKELKMTKKPKARLVNLGYEDPLIDTLPRDSPTLGRDSRMLALQCIASHRWSVRSFDIRTAFLRGSRQDDRILGIEPPAELRSKMNLKPNEVCELLKGAYGLINAPLLWYCELKAALLSLGFIVSPMDPCLFVLPKNKSDDDSPNGGDATFSQAIQKLEKRFPFGSQRTGNFTFTGIHIHQDHNGDISLDQQDYINDIPPIDIPRERRKTPEAKINNEELQKLRGLIGSLQYAATNTRPDLSCKLSLLQARVTCATINDLLQGNRILNEAKRFSETAIRVQALPLQELRFLSFSDAAFATREKAHSQKGCVILATTETIDKTQSALVSPLLWFSKKINRVVSSTLASETFALSGALDLLSWTRVHWAWLLNPNLEWKNPEATLKKLPSAFAVVDCKSLFDLLQKTSVPQCSEYRTMLEALVVKERLKEGVIIKWVHSAAQMADSLTKDMDTTVLRSFLSKGKCILHDVDEILKQRADKKVRQQWYQTTSDSPVESALHVFACILDIPDGTE